MLKTVYWVFFCVGVHGIWLSFFAIHSFFSHVFVTWHLDLVIAEDLFLDPDPHALCCGSLLWVHGFISVNLLPCFSLSTWLIGVSLQCALLTCLSVGLSTWLLFMSHALLFVPQCVWTPLPCWPDYLFSDLTCLPQLTLDYSVQPVSVDLVPVHFGCYTCQCFFLCVFSGSRPSVQVLVLSSALQGAFCLFNRYDPIHLLGLANDF